MFPEQRTSGKHRSRFTVRCVESREGSNGRRRLVLILLALLIVLVSGWAAFVGTFWGFGLKCDDSCSTLPGWQEDADAWQWSALGWSSIGTFVCALLLLGALIARRRALAWVAAGGSVALGLAFLALLDDSGLT
jgi:hypothetical protein